MNSILVHRANKSLTSCCHIISKTPFHPAVSPSLPPVSGCDSTNTSTFSNLSQLRFSPLSQHCQLLTRMKPITSWLLGLINNTKYLLSGAFDTTDYSLSPKMPTSHWLLKHYTIFSLPLCFLLTKIILSRPPLPTPLASKPHLSFLTLSIKTPSCSMGPFSLITSDLCCQCYSGLLNSI